MMGNSKVGYNRHVRRILAISLMFLFSLPLVSPLFALSANSGEKLPACCRKNGLHHCAAKAQGEQSLEVRISVRQEKCPSYPKALTSTQRRDSSMRASARLNTDVLVQLAGKVQVEARARIALYRSLQERGPPALYA